MWNSIGNKLIAMAQDFPKDKYDFKVQKDQRTFAQTLLHVAGVDYLLNLIQQAVADGANLIQQQGDAGLEETTKFPFGNKLVHNSYNWMFVIEDSGEHYGQLVVYYRANNMVPLASRPR
jgi:hypothetical protein